MNKFYITTPIFYPNAKLHMGHAYTTTITDVLARYHRLLGSETHFLTGSDENTQKMVDAAHKVGEEPMAFLDGIVRNFHTLYASLNISYDQFIRTTDQKVHWPGAQELWRKLEANGDIYKKQYEGLYCIGHEAFITEKELVDGKCPDHDTEPQLVQEENYFFKLSRYADQIKDAIETERLRIVPESRKNEILSFISDGLEDVSFSRPKRKDWPQELGVPVPGDNTQTVYVWCDALANYITAIGYGRDEQQFKKFWPADIHVIGKDILRFHAAIWPGMLLSAGVELPKMLLVHGFITSGNQKMSKSLGNVISPLDLVERYGTDAARYLLARHVHPFEDTDITWERLDEWYTAHLVNGLGNVVARVMKMSETHLRNAPVLEAGKTYAGEICNGNVQALADDVWSRIGHLDERIAVTEPFKLIKTEPERGKVIIDELRVELWFIARLLEPLMPQTSAAIQVAIRENKKPENLFPRLENRLEN